MNIDQVDSNGASLLHLAIERGDDYSAMFLLDHGAKVNGKRFLDQSTPLHLTAQHSSMTGVAEALLDQGASMEAATQLEQFIPMHLAIEKENHALFQLLLDRGSPLETPSGEGFPPLWYALLINDKAMAIQLIEKGASVNSLCDNDGNTLVHSLIKVKGLMSLKKIQNRQNFSKISNIPKKNFKIFKNFKKLSRISEFFKIFQKNFKN